MPAPHPVDPPKVAARRRRRLRGLAASALVPGRTQDRRSIRQVSVSPEAPKRPESPVDPTPTDSSCRSLVTSPRASRLAPVSRLGADPSSPPPTEVADGSLRSGRELCPVPMSLHLVDGVGWAEAPSSPPRSVCARRNVDQLRACKTPGQEVLRKTQGYPRKFLVTPKFRCSVHPIPTACAQARAQAGRAVVTDFSPDG